MKLSLKDLTTEEKLRLLCGLDGWHTADLEGKLPRITVSDGPVGVRKVDFVEGGREIPVPAVAFPSIQLLANTWSKDCARAMGEALADECKERDADVLLAPGVNIKRMPLCGRNFEYFSEDPYLAGTLAKEYIDGVQQNGVGTCLKHFLANNLECDRLQRSSDVDERTLREIYYRQFQIACEAKPVSVMCSYNRINGVYASENEKGFKVLREEFGFDGAIVSDWYAVRDRAAAAKAGLDLEMPFHEGNYEKLVSDFKAGKITEEEVDVCAQRMLDFIYRVKEMRKQDKQKTTRKERVERAKQIASEGMVLLKNNGVLPLEKKSRVAVCGGYAKPESWDMLCGGGSAKVLPLDDKFDLPACLKERGLEVKFEGAFRNGGVACFSQNSRLAVLNALESDVNVVCAGTGSYFEYEEEDRKTLRLPQVQEQIILETARANPNTVVVIFAGGAIDVSPWCDEVAAILFAGFAGMGGDEVVADILTGKINPSGKTSETFAPLEEYPAYSAFSSTGVTRYEEGLDVGYRYFSTYRIPVLYPFGHGLSYAKFEYGNLKLSVQDGALKVGFEISNTSRADGKETAQIYVRPCAPLVYRPDRELKGYVKEEIKAGARKEVCVSLRRSDFAYWSIARDKWYAEDGVYEILVGASAEDVRLAKKVKIQDGKISVL